MISNFSRGDRGFAKVPCFILILSRRFSFFMFRRATRSAPREISTAVPVAESIFLTSAAIMHPVPVPKSKILGACHPSDKTDSTNVSVSGRGSSVLRFV